MLAPVRSGWVRTGHGIGTSEEPPIEAGAMLLSLAGGEVAQSRTRLQRRRPPESKGVFFVGNATCGTLSSYRHLAGFDLGAIPRNLTRTSSRHKRYPTTSRDETPGGRWCWVNDSRSPGAPVLNASSGQIWWTVRLNTVEPTR